MRRRLEQEQELRKREAGEHEVRVRHLSAQLESANAKPQIPLEVCESSRMSDFLYARLSANSHLRSAL